MSEHTPGPWAADMSPHTAPHIMDFPAVVGPDGNPIAALGDYEPGNENPYRKVDEGYANARLIAAAPDLLEALEGVVRLKKVQGVLESWEMDTFIGIIAKATGGKQ